MDILKQYEENKSRFEEFTRKLDILLMELFKSEDIFPHQITSRVKGIESLKRKIESKKNKYSDISEITDCVGLRVISYLEDEVDRIAELIEKEFVIDKNNSVDKRSLDIDRFGYKSLHYVISLSDSRKFLSEYSRYQNIKAEIQIRSILQHSWAEIEHDLGYKSSITVPDIVKRDFYRVAALLEVADIEFVKIKNSINDYNKLIEKEIDTNPATFSIDINTLEAFVDRSDIVKRIGQKIIEGTNAEINSNFGEFDYVLEIFKKYMIFTIKDLLIKLSKYEKVIIAFERECLQEVYGTNSSIGKAAAIHSLASIILFENNDPGFYPGDSIPFLKAKKIFDRIKK